MSLDRNKVALVQVARQQLGLQDDDYRAILSRLAGATSSRELDDPGFRRVMAYFNSLGFESTSSKRNFGRRDFMATPAQIHRIRALWHDYTDGQGTDITLGKWLDRTFKVSALRFLEAEPAPRVITALKAMVQKRPARVEEVPVA